MAGKGAERMCVACRERARPDELVRLVRHPVTGDIVVDLPGKLPGRGAWVHARRSCVEDLERKGGKLSHALDGKVDATGLADRVRAAVLRAVEDGISMAAASGSLIGGHDRLVTDLRHGTVTTVIVAHDASPRTLASLRRAADDEESDVVFVEVGIDRDGLGQRTGRGARAALGVRATRGSAFLRRQLRRLRDLG